MTDTTQQDCVFCKITAGELPAEVVYEDERCLAVMDKFPLTEGQVLLIGKTHIDYIFDVPEDQYNHLFSVTRTLGPAIDTAFETIRTWIIVQGMEVPHVHIKLLPVYPDRHISLEEGTGVEASDEHLEKLAEKIRKTIKK